MSLLDLVKKYQIPSEQVTEAVSKAGPLAGPDLLLAIKDFVNSIAVASTHAVVSFDGSVKDGYSVILSFLDMVKVKQDPRLLNNKTAPGFNAG